MKISNRYACGVETKERGFSLIELLLVVAIIGIIAAIAVPSLIHARRAAHSASAVSSLRIIHSSQATYHNSNGRYGDLTALSNNISDPLLRQGSKSHYNFTVTPDATSPDIAYTARATPADPTTVTTWRHYFVDASGVLRWKHGTPADITSEAVN